MIDNIDIKISSLMEKHKSTEFKWGLFDCCKFAIESIECIHGVSINIGDYETQKGARRVLKDNGGTFDLALKHVGLIEHPASMAKRGDLVTVKNDDAWGTALGLVVGVVAMCPSNIGLVPVHRDRWQKSWAVPCQL